MQFSQKCSIIFIVVGKITHISFIAQKQSKDGVCPCPAKGGRGMVCPFLEAGRAHGVQAGWQLEKGWIADGKKQINW